MIHIQLDNIMSVYCGKDGNCCCGCSGKHTYAKAHQQAASKSRGYPVTDDEINDRTVKKIYNLFARTPEEEIDVNSNTCYSTVVGKRIYILYMKEPQK